MSQDIPIELVIAELQAQIGRLSFELAVAKAQLGQALHSESAPPTQEQQDAPQQ